MIKHIRVRSRTGEVFLENAFNIEVHEKLGDYSTLSFSLPFKDPKCEFIEIEAEIIFEDKRYRITEINDARTEEGVETKEVFAEEAFLELAWYARPKTYKVTQKTISAGITQILSGTGWTKGIVENEDPNKLYSLTLENSTVLAILRQWAAITQKEIVFDTVNKKVSFVDRVGTNRGAMLRYRKNLKGIKCTIQPVQATVLYPYGKDGLDIRGVNNNIPYIEDYSWYTQQGIPLDEARSKYKKEYIWVNESIETAWTLLDSAISVLKNLSRPTITYECSVLDLENISPFDKLYLGDDVKVHDEALGIDINTRIVEIVRHIDNPAENEIVLGNSVPGLEDAELGKVTHITVEDKNDFSIERLDRDVNGKFRKVVYYRKDGTKYMESVLEGTSPNYIYRWEYYYDQAGENVVETRKYQRYYDDLNNLVKEVWIL